mgnify:CR=1 FL=1
MSAQTVKELDGAREEDRAEAGSPGLVLVFSGTRPYLLPFALRPGVMEFGRDELARARIEDDRVSRRHVAIEREAAALRVRDLGSTNGVFLDARRLPAQAVAAVDPRKPAVLRIGRTLFLIVADLAPYQQALDQPLIEDGIIAGPALRAALRFLGQQDHPDCSDVTTLLQRATSCFDITTIPASIPSRIGEGSVGKRVFYQMIPCPALAPDGEYTTLSGYTGREEHVGSRTFLETDTVQLPHMRPTEQKVITRAQACEGQRAELDPYTRYTTSNPCRGL